MWFARARQAPDTLSFTLRTVKFLDDRIANPAYGVVAITGVLLVWIGPYSFATPWVLASMILFGIVGAVAGALYSPTLRRQIALVNAGTSSAEFQALSQKGTLLCVVLAALVLAIFYLMVAQPPLWG